MVPMKGAVRVFIASLILLLSSASLAQNDEAQKRDEPSYPRLKLGGQFQLQLDDGDLKASSRRPVRNGIGFRDTDSRIDIRRLRLYATAYFSDQVSIVTETDFEAEDLEPDEVTLTPLDIYLKYQFAEGHHLRIGQAKIPFGHEFLKTSRHLTVIERSDVSRMFFQRDIGVGLFGQREKMEYAFGVYQGQGENVAERNGANDIAGKFEYQVTPGLRLPVISVCTARNGTSPTFPSDDWDLRPSTKTALGSSRVSILWGTAITCSAMPTLPPGATISTTW